MTCSDCGQAYCGDCTIDFQERPFCGACKLRAVRRATAGPEFKLPDEALKYAIVGIFCFGIVLEPVALVKSIQALQQIQARPGLPGKGKSIAALVIAGVFLALNVLYIGALIVGAAL